ncbi:unnamed protein product [Sphagnum jensenii]|uniref:Uncharacterized protein n=1 Tax=Sphagnum jensenii TaxID=128206 RepID=A0ABP1BLX9_9BRYO
MRYPDAQPTRRNKRRPLLRTLLSTNKRSYLVSFMRRHQGGPQQCQWPTRPCRLAGGPASMRAGHQFGRRVWPRLPSTSSGWRSAARHGYGPNARCIVGG